MGGEVTKNVVFTAKMRDDTKAGFDKVKRNARAASKEMAKASGAMVSEKAGRAMSQFNEKTEKGRQLLTAFGGAVGGAAGNVVYYGGTLSYVIGRFSVWELAIMGVVAVIGGLIYIITRASKQEKIWASRIKESRKQLDQLHRSVTDFLESERQQAEGWSRQDVHLAKVNAQMRVQTARLKEFGKEYQKLWNKASYAEMVAGVADVSDAMVSGVTQAWVELGRLQKLKEQLLVSDEAAKRKVMAREFKEQTEAIAEAAKRRAEERRKEAEQLKAFQLTKVAAFTKGLKATLDAERQAEVERTARFLRINEAVRAYLDRQQEIRDIAFQRKYEGWRAELAIEASLNMQRFDMAEKTRQEALDREKAAAEQRLEYAAMGADAMVGLFSAIATGSARQVADTLKAMAFEALARAAWHGIMAVASALLGGGLHTGQHATMAALYAGFAATYGAGAMVASGLAGGGGGGGGIGGGGGYDISNRAGYEERGEEDQKTYAVFYVYGHQFFGNDVRGDRDLNDRVVRYKESQNPGRESDRF